MDLKEIQELIKFISKSTVTQVDIERKDFRITIKKEKRKASKVKNEVFTIPAQAPVAQVAAPVATPAPVEVVPEATVEDKYITVKSPMIGTFYRSPGPDKDSFVNVGDTIKPGVTVCIVEAMKLFNEIESEVSGTIVKVLVDDTTPVEYDQPLFLVDPS